MANTDTHLEHNPNDDRDSNGGGGTSVDHRQLEASTWWLLSTLLVANVAVFIVTMVVNNCPRNNDASKVQCFPRVLGRLSFQPVQENPLIGPSSSTLIRMGALPQNKVVHEHQRWRLVASMWLHLGFIHVLVNMLSLTDLIHISEKMRKMSMGPHFGFLKGGMIYLLSGFGGSLLSSIFLRDDPSVGASGAVFGLLGALLSELLINWTYVEKGSLFSLFITISPSLFVVILLRANTFVLIGGFTTGFLLGIVLLICPSRRLGLMEPGQLPEHALVKTKYMAPGQQALVVFALAWLILGFVVSLVMLFRGVNGNDHCRWCHNMSCVSFAMWRCHN